MKGVFLAYLFLTLIVMSVVAGQTESTTQTVPYQIEHKTNFPEWKIIIKPFNTLRFYELGDPLGTIYTVYNYGEETKEVTISQNYTVSNETGNVVYKSDEISQKVVVAPSSSEIISLLIPAPAIGEGKFRILVERTIIDPVRNEELESTSFTLIDRGISDLSDEVKSISDKQDDLEIGIANINNHVSSISKDVGDIKSEVDFFKGRADIFIVVVVAIAVAIGFHVIRQPKITDAHIEKMTNSLYKKIEGDSNSKFRKSLATLVAKIQSKDKK